MRKKCQLLSAILLVGMLLMPMSQAAGADYIPRPQTAYAREFVSACEGQTWFMSAVEKVLNANQKTINTITSSNDLSVIKSLGLKGCHFTGQIPPAIGELKELRYLFLADNQLTGALPVTLFALPKLENIDLADNNFKDGIPGEFGLMPALRYLSLRGNKYTGTIPETILANNTLQFFDVSSNNLSGELPETLNQMTSLQYLALSDNEWDASVLPDLSALSNLKVLSAWNCQLTGEIPESLYTMTALQVLDLDTNALSGTISKDIEKLTNLQQMSLGHNQLQGMVPAELGTLEKMVTLDISHNCLRGELPDTITAYNEVYVQNNYMTGDILRGLENNEGNFVDQAFTGQYQLILSEPTVQLNQTDAVNIYPLIQKQPLTGGEAEEITLGPDDFTLTYDDTKVEITVDEDGIHAKALTDILDTEELTVTIQINGNSNSEYSAATVIVMTEGKENPEPEPSPSPSPSPEPEPSPSPSPEPEPSPSPSVVPSPMPSPSPEPEPVPVHHNLYVSGFPDGTFCADAHITREQVAKMLIDALEKKTEAPSAQSYSDVSKQRWSFAWVETATQEGYLEGYGGGIFGPDRAITRAEMATILTRIADTENMTIKSGIKNFSDVPKNRWYSDYIQKAVQYGLINGYTDGTFRPNQNITRAEAVTMINRMLNRDYATATELQKVTCPFPDVAKEYWGYGDIMEASIAHNH